MISERFVERPVDRVFAELFEFVHIYACHSCRKSIKLLYTGITIGFGEMLSPLMMDYFVKHSRMGIGRKDRTHMLSCGVVFLAQCDMHNHRNILLVSIAAYILHILIAYIVKVLHVHQLSRIR